MPGRADAGEEFRLAQGRLFRDLPNVRAFALAGPKLRQIVDDHEEFARSERAQFPEGQPGREAASVMGARQRLDLL